MCSIAAPSVLVEVYCGNEWLSHSRDLSGNGLLCDTPREYVLISILFNVFNNYADLVF